MSLTDDEKERLRQLLEKVPDDELAAILESAEKARSTLDEKNPAHPETRKFLADRGLTRVSQLNEAGRKELTAHLEGVLLQILTENQSH